MNDKKILVISYFPPNEFGSMNLWTRDKLYILYKMGFKTDLITSPIVTKHSLYTNRTYRINSLYPSVFWSEFKSAKNYSGLWVLPFVFSIGIIQEILERIVLKRVGQGMWGWTLPSLVSIVILSLFSNYFAILSLGGPTSAHLSNAISSYLIKTKNIIEFQDPIVGRDIAHNALSAKYFGYLEKLLVRSKSKLVFVTKAATNECKIRYPYNENIYCVYSSSPDVENLIPCVQKKYQDVDPIKIGYFGEMYASRNYDSLFNSIIYISLLKKEISFEIHHYGSNPFLDYTFIPLNLNFIIKTTLTRENALNEASWYSMLLLVQHKDNRSKLTIPYKTWDYLNLQKPILALLNNDELKELLDDLGHYTCDVNNVDSIVDAILRFLDDYKNDKIRIKPNPYDISKQVIELISL